MARGTTGATALARVWAMRDGAAIGGTVGDVTDGATGGATVGARAGGARIMDGVHLEGAERTGVKGRGGAGRKAILETRGWEDGGTKAMAELAAITMEANAGN